MSMKRYTQEFKVEAVGQVVEKGYRAADVAAWLGVSQHSLYEWIKERRQPAAVDCRFVCPAPGGLLHRRVLPGLHRRTR